MSKHNSRNGHEQFQPGEELIWRKPGQEPVSVIYLSPGPWSPNGKLYVQLPSGERTHASTRNCARPKEE